MIGNLKLIVDSFCELAPNLEEVVDILQLVLTTLAFSPSRIPEINPGAEISIKHILLLVRHNMLNHHTIL